MSRRERMTTKYFNIKLHERMLPVVIKPATSWSPVGCAFKWAIDAGKKKKKTRGPWWSYIAHLSKQLCKLTVEVSAKFTALRFLYKFYSPTPERLCFFHASWLLELNLERRSPKEQFCQVILKLVQWFLTKRFLSVLYSYIGKISPTPQRPYFLTNQDSLNKLGRVPPKEHSCKLYWNQFCGFWQEDF